MPFQIRWLTTRVKTRQAAYQSTHYPETGYIFNRTKSCTEWDLYTCSFCVSISKQKKNNQEHCPSIPSIRVIGDSYHFIFFVILCSCSSILLNCFSITHLCVKWHKIIKCWMLFFLQFHLKTCKFSLIFSKVKFLPGLSSFPNSGSCAKISRQFRRKYRAKFSYEMSRLSEKV
jgi:hypothetical protein